MSDSPEDRLVFISHKHDDHDLATCVGDFVTDLSGNRVSNFVSSSPNERRPNFGDNLPEALKESLARTGLVVLVYTDPTDNWEWNLWECGVATDPADSNPTKIIVFVFGGVAPDQYKATLNVVVDLDNERTERRLRSFATDFCRKEDFWPDGRGAINPTARDDDIERRVDDFLRRLKKINLRGVNRTREKMLRIAQRITGNSADFLIPLTENAERALSWGLDHDMCAELFKDLWRATYTDDMQQLANQTLIFRPPMVVRFWERLLETVVARDGDEAGDNKRIRLLSGEGEDPIAFWVEARENEDSDAHMYEEPVRATAQQLFKEYGQNMVERRFALTQDFFNDPDNIERFQNVAAWMGEAHITVAVARREDIFDSRWLDFAIVGDIAVSRFDSTASIQNRVIKECFIPDEVSSAMAQWDTTIKARWTSDGDVSLEDFLSQRNGRI